jgi:hypothetical protein
MKKLFTSMFLVLALLAMTVGTAFAQEATPISGTVQSVVLETDATTGETTAVVTVLDETTGATQTVTISLETAASLGLVATDPTTGETTVTDTAVGSTVEIDPTTVISTDTTEEEQHPVGSALSDFFGDLLGADYDTIMTAHEDGVGFGVIAQALWLTNELGGDSTTFEALVEAKQSGDYSAITLADGSTPDNWGDVVKSLKKGDNLGSVMSGKGQPAVDDETTDDGTGEEVTTTSTTTTAPTNGHGNSGKGNSGKGHGKGGGGRP